MKPRYLFKHLRVMLAAAAWLPAMAALAADLPYADKPLFYASGVKPNVALLVDNSKSMEADDTGGSGTIVSSCGNAVTLTQPLTRMEAAKQAACQVVQDNAAGMRIGLYTFTGGLNTTNTNSKGIEVEDFGATASVLQTSIRNLSSDQPTPLGGAMLVMANRYLGSNSPLQYRCQKNYVVFFTDGEPSSGIDYSTSQNDSVLGTTAGGSFALPSLPLSMGQQSSPWPSSTAATGATTGSPNWDGMPDPIYVGGISRKVYPWLDDLAQLIFDVDIKNNSSTTPAALCGGTAPAVGKDCAGKSWEGDDDEVPSQYRLQNVITYTVGLGAEADNGLLRNTPLVNRIAVGPTDVNVGDDTIRLTGHALKTGDFVHYYAAFNTPTYSTTAEADTTSDSLSGDTLNMTNGIALTYSNGGGANLQYEQLTTPEIPGPSCGRINGLTSGNSYYVHRLGTGTFRLAASSREAWPNSPVINLTSMGTAGTVHTFTRTHASASFYANTSSNVPVDTSTDVITRTGHPFVTGDQVTYTRRTGSGSSNIGGLNNGSSYFVAVLSSDTFKLAATSAANATDCAAGITANCIDLSSQGTNNHWHTFEKTASTVATSFTATGSGTVPVDTGNERITSSSHGFSTGDRVTYTCTNGTSTPAVYTAANIPATVYARDVTEGSPGTFSIALTSGGPAIDIVGAGTAAQTFTWSGSSVALPTIGGLYPYETDLRPDNSPTPSTEPSARGKYYVEVVDANNIKLRQCGNVLGCTVPAGSTVDLSGTDGHGVFSTGPGKSYFAATATELSAALSSAFAEIRSLSLSFGTLGANDNQQPLNVGTRLYQGRFNTSDWSGDVRALRILANGQPDPNQVWLASEKIPAPALRNILTRNDTNGAFAFTTGNWGSLTGVQQTSLSNGVSQAVGEAVINWTRGQDAAGYRTRSNGVLGDIINSGISYVGQPNANYQSALPDSATGKTSYSTFKGQPRDPMVYVGSNGGMVHGFEASTAPGTQGVEKVAFIPEAVYMDWADADNDGVKDGGEAAVNKFYDVARPNYGLLIGQDHHYFVNATPKTGDAFFKTAKAGLIANQWHTVLVGGLGKGGRSVYALDVTNNTYAAEDVLWEFNDNNSGDMGYSYGEPTIERLADDRWVAIFGNGYDSRDDQARMYIVDLETGALIQEITLGAPGGNGLSSVSVLRSNTATDGVTALTAYAGDLQGNVWKVDLSDPSALPTSVTTPFFVAEDDLGNRQAITSSITLKRYPAVHASGVMLFFGTGSYFREQDKSYTGTPVYDAMYGIWDKGDVATVALDDLVEQQLYSPEQLDPDGDGDYDEYRKLTSKPVDYSGASPDRGWFLKLASTLPLPAVYRGERVVFSPTTTNLGSYLLITTVVPADLDPCVGGGTSWSFRIDALTGGAKPYAVYDLNDNGDFEDDEAGYASKNEEGLAAGTSVYEGDDSLQGCVNMNDPKCGNLNKETEIASPGTFSSGRMSWRQLQ